MASRFSQKHQLFHPKLTSVMLLLTVGFLIDVGVRDETSETSGALLALKNTYLKTLKHTNETINYGMT